MSTVIAPLAGPRRDVEREGGGRADLRLPEPAEQDAQHRVGVGGGADRGAGVTAHPLLVDADRGRQPVEYVDLRPGQRGHEALHEGAVGLVDQPLRLRGDRAEHQRALARAGDAREHRQPALRELEAEVLEVVHARAVHADQVVGVGGVRRGRPRGLRRRHAHRVSPSLGPEWNGDVHGHARRGSVTGASRFLIAARRLSRLAPNPPRRPRLLRAASAARRPARRRRRSS